jgi:hypothetical protein
LDEIQEQHGSDDQLDEDGNAFFDSYDPDLRHSLTIEDLGELPMLDEAGSEIPIYSKDGFRIHRRLGARSRGTRPHGILMDLYKLDELFLSDDLFGDSNPSGKSTTYSVYPQAGLVTAGHFQADGLVSAFWPLLEKLNSAVQLQAEDDSDDMADDDQLMAPIVGAGCQGYNALMHVTRGRCAQHHDAQRGIVTSALAGSWAKTNANSQKARSLILRCKNRLPHDEFNEKISTHAGEMLDCSLRLENTFNVDLDRLAPEYRSGR